MTETRSVQDIIMELINSRIGKKAGIHQNNLLAYLHQQEYRFRYEVPNTRKLLDIIHDMRRSGYVIASGPYGYFKPVDVAEAWDYVDTVLKSRETDLAITRRRQRQAIINEYGRQIPMPLKTNQEE